MSGSTFTSNSAGVGGGLANFGTATVSGSTFTSNSAGESGGLGGGIDNGGMLTVSGSTFTSNSAAATTAAASTTAGWDGDGERQHLHQQLRRASTAAASPTSGRRR